MNTKIQATPTNNTLALITTKNQQTKKINSNNSAKLCIYRNAINPRINTNPSIAIKHMHFIPIMALFFISMALVSWEKAHAATQLENNSVKWHPGHYYRILDWGKNNRWGHLTNDVYPEILATPALRGIQLRYTWAELEPEERVYDFSSIDQRLIELAAIEKRLIIILDTKTFKLDVSPVPDYVRTEKYEGGVYTLARYNDPTPRGYNTKLWNPHVHDRLAALIKELGERYNHHPYFEAIGLSETSMGTPPDTFSDCQTNQHYNSLLSLNLYLRKYFPNTVTFQNTNYPRDILERFTGRLADMGAGLGVPDVFIEDPGLNMKDYPYTPDGVYSYFQKLSGIVPLAPSVMHLDYTNTRHDKTGYDPTVLELLSYARDNLKANYIFWMRIPEHYEEVLQVLNWPNQTSDPAGGLDSTCPVAYFSCVEIVKSQ